MSLLKFVKGLGSLIRALLLHFAAKLHGLDAVVAHPALVTQHPRQQPHDWQIPLQSAEELRHRVGIPLQVRRDHPRTTSSPAGLRSTATAWAAAETGAVATPEGRRWLVQRFVGGEGRGHGGLHHHRHARIQFPKLSNNRLQNRKRLRNNPSCTTDSFGVAFVSSADYPLRIIQQLVRVMDG